MPGPLIFVSEPAPQRNGQRVPLGALDPHTVVGRKMAALLGVESVPASFGAIALRTSGARARAEARALWQTLPDGARVVLVGGQVAHAFDVPPQPLRWVAVVHPVQIVHEVAFVPHPQDARWWGVPANAHKAQRFLRGLGKEALA